jgi:hypothetical protein
MVTAAASRGRCKPHAPSEVGAVQKEDAMKLYRLLDQNDEVMAQAVTNDGITERKAEKLLKARAEKLGCTLEVSNLDTLTDLQNELDELASVLSDLGM